MVSSPLLYIFYFAIKYISIVKDNKRRYSCRHKTRPSTHRHIHTIFTDYI